MSTPVIIDAAARADLPALKALIEGSYRGDHARHGWTHEADIVEDERITPDELAGLYSNPNVAILVARSGADIVGCVTVTDRPGGMAHIGLLCVDPPFQSSGLGSRLLHTAELLCTHLGAESMEMTVIEDRAPLIAWYLRKGWRETGERRPFPVPQDRPLHFIVLEKRPDPA